MGCTSAKPARAAPTNTDRVFKPSKDVIDQLVKEASDQPQSHRQSEGSVRAGQSWVKDDLGFKAHLAKINLFSQLERKYEMGALLGEGITGQVRLCVSKIDGNVHALKSLNVSKMDESQLNELKAEIEMLKHLDHPNIVSLMEIFASENNICLIMEYCGGGDLSDRRFRSEKDLSSVLYQVLRAVAHCHQMGIMHRDLKLENVMFVSKDSDELRLIDFGLSKLYFQDSESQKTSLERLNERSRAMATVCGTVCYMAPEVLTRTYGQKADVWAVGIMAFTLMSGGPPFIGDDDLDVLRQVRRGVIRYDEHVWKRLSQPAVDFVKTLLTYDPELRPSARDALRLPWLSNYQKYYWETNPVDKNLGKLAWQSILRFATYPLLKKAAWMVIAHYASAVNKASLRHLFLYLDTDNTGELKMEHLLKLMDEFSDEANKVSKEQVGTLFNVIDQDRTGAIHFMEFLSATIEATVTASARLIDQAFDHLDADSSGFISVDNIRDLLGERYTIEDAKDILDQGFKSLDMEPQKDVSRSHFFQMMEKVGLPSPFTQKLSPEKPKLKAQEDLVPSPIRPSLTIGEFGSNVHQHSGASELGSLHHRSGATELGSVFSAPLEAIEEGT